MRWPWSRKSLDEMSFREYLRVLRGNGGDSDSVKLADGFASTIPLVLIKQYPHLTMKSVDEMEWREVKSRLSLIEAEMAKNAEMMNSLLDRIPSNDGWDYELVNMR